MTRRRITRAIAWLALGCVTTWVVAVACAQDWWPARVTSSPHWYFYDESLGREVSWWEYRAIGYRAIHGKGAWRPGNIHFREEPPALWRSVKLESDGYAHVQASGFPLPAVKCGHSSIEEIGYWGAWSILQTDERTAWGGGVLLPFSPIWLGLAADTLFFAALFAGSTGLVIGVRRKHRRNRGRCPSCGYDRNGITGPCPECGPAP